MKLAMILASTLAAMAMIVMLPISSAAAAGAGSQPAAGLGICQQWKACQFLFDQLPTA